MHTKDYYRLFLTILSVCFGIIFFESKSIAISITEEYFVYTENEDGTLTLTEYTYPIANEVHHYPDLTIKNKVNEKTVVAIADNVFKERYFSNIFIDNNINIGSSAFANASIFGSLTIGTDNSGKNVIDKYAFSDAYIFNIYIKSAIELNDYCFRNTCFQSEFVQQKDSIVTTIGKGAFMGSSYVQGLNYSSLVSIGENAFFNAQIHEFTIPSTIKDIEKGAFGYNDSFAPKDRLKIYIDSSITDITNFYFEALDSAILGIDAQSPLIDYCVTNNLPHFLTNDSESGISKANVNQVLFGDSYTIMVNGDNTATLINIYSNSDYLYLNEQYNIDYHGYTYTINNIAQSVISHVNCPNVDTIILGNNITQLEANSIMPEAPYTIVLSPNISNISNAYDYNDGNITVVIPPTLRTLTDQLSEYIGIESNNSFLIEQNSPLLWLFSSYAHLYYTVYSENNFNEYISSTSPDNSILYDDNEDEIINTELIRNGDFEDGEFHWTSHINVSDAATYNFVDGTAIFDITDVGLDNSTVQLRQTAFTETELGSVYHLEMKITSDVARKIEVVFLTPNSGHYYGGDIYDLAAGEVTIISSDILITEEQQYAKRQYMDFVLCMGKVGEDDVPGRIVVDSISLKKTDKTADSILPDDSVSTESSDNPDSTETPTEEVTTADSNTQNSTEEITQAPTEESSTEQSTTEESINQGNTDVNNQNGAVTPDTSNPSDTGTTDSNNSSNSGTNDNNNSSTNTDNTTTPPTQTKKKPEKGTLIIHKKLQYKVIGTNTVTFIKPLNKKITKLTIPATFTYEGYKYKVTKVSNKACYQYKKLKKVTIGNNVTQVGDNAFAKCTVLNNITFGTSVKKLGKKVLYNDIKLSKITFKGKKLQSIGKQTFRKVPKSVRIIVPNSRVSKYSRLINNAV